MTSPITQESNRRDTERRSSIAVDCRAAPLPYVVLSVMGGFMTFIIVAAIARRGMHWNALVMLLLIAAICLFFLSWLFRFRVLILNGRLEYRTLFGTKSVALQDIASARLETGVRSFADWFRPLGRLIVEPAAGKGAKAIVINAKVLRRPDRQSLAKILGA